MRTPDEPDALCHALGKVETESDRMTDAGRGPAAAGPAGLRPAARPRAEVDLTRLLLEAVADARVVAPDHQWQLALPDEPVEVTGDEQRLHQVVTNLLTNARKPHPAPARPSP